MSIQSVGHNSLSSQYNLFQLCLQVSILLVGLTVALGHLSAIQLIYVVALSQFGAITEVLSAIKRGISSQVAASVAQVSARLAVTFALFVFMSIGPIWIAVFLAMVWAVADGIRYLYYIRKASKVLAWLRYNSFIVLYPLGMSLENIIVWKILLRYSESPVWLFLAFLACYSIPAIKIYMYMLRQRKKHLPNRES